MHFEGSGETMLWNGKILTGYGCRSTVEVIQFLKEYFNREVFGFELRNPMFYHLDTALCPLSNDLIAVYEDAFTDEGKKTLESLKCRIMKVAFEDAKAFALNSIVLGKHAVVHYEAKGFIK